MTRRLSPLVGSIALGTILSLTAAANSLADTTVTAPGDPQLAVPTPVRKQHMSGADKSVIKKRGIAILARSKAPTAMIRPSAERRYSRRTIPIIARTGFIARES